MLTIKDLPQAEELDTRAMSAVRGGHKFVFGDVSNSGNFQIGDGNLGIVGNGNVVGDGNQVNNGSIKVKVGHGHFPFPTPY